MKKIIIIMVLLFSLLIINVSGVTLVDSEDFESYSLYATNDSFITESGGKWNCSNPLQYPSCNEVLGTGLGEVGYSIQYDEAEESQYFLLYSINGDSVNYNILNINFDMDNSTENIFNNFSMTYKIKLNGYSTLTGNGWGSWFMIRHTPDNDISLNEVLAEGMGGIQDKTENNNTDLRMTHDSPNFLYPINSLTDISDGEWHYITIHYIFSGNTINRIEHYLDGIFTDSRNIGYSNWANYTSKTPFFEELNFNVKRSYSVGIDDLKMYEVLVTPSFALESLSNCPTESCLYYDEFEIYNNYIDFLVKGYIGNLENAIFFNNSQLLFNGTSEDYPYFKHNLKDDIYETIEGVMLIDLNYDITPEEFIETPYTLLYSLKCDNDFEVHNINMAFINDELFTGSNDSTVLHFYSSDNLQSLGTYTILNSNKIAIKFDYNDVTNQYGITVNQNKILQNLGFSNTPDFRNNYNLNNCDYFTDIEVRRRDYRDNDSTNSYIGIDKFWIYGTSTPTIESTEYINTSEFVVEKDWEETTKNGIENLGFRSIVSKLMLVAFVIIFLLVIFSDLPKEQYKAVAGVSTIAVLIVGFYIELIPKEIFIFFIFIVAIIGALLLTFAFKKGEN